MSDSDNSSGATSVSADEPLSGNGESKDDSSESEGLKDNTVYYNGSEISLLPDVVKNYLESDNKAEFLTKNSGTDGDNVKQLSIVWRDNGVTAYNFELATDGDFENMVFSASVATNRITLRNLIPNAYYYRVTDDKGNIVKKDFFVLSDKIRTISCGNIRNVRDMGGKTTSDGVIKYGLVYRTPEIVGADKTAKEVLIDELGVKTEIDLRKDTTTESISDRITKYKLGIVQWDYIFPELNVSRPTDKSAITNLKAVFELFTDMRNYPIVFHCTSGADRTGTLAFLLNGLLGASYEDLAEDFEITSFYFGARWRSDIKYENGKYAFGDSGVMQDNAGNLIFFGRVYDHIMATYKTKDGTLSGAIENYLKTEVGLTDDDIYSIKHIMLGVYEHKYGEWEIVNEGSCQENGEKRRYCSCGLYESETIDAIGGHVYGEWVIEIEPIAEKEGLRKRYCVCGAEQSEVLPKRIKTVYDFNDVDIKADVTTGVISAGKAKTVTDFSSVPDGYEGGVYSGSGSYLICIGIGFDKEYKLEDLVEMKIRLMVASDTKLSKGNVRIYDDTNNSIYADKNFDNDLSGVYNEWMEIDLLPLLKESVAMTDTLTANGALKKFTLLIRTGVYATVYFDSVTVLSAETAV